MKGQNLIQLRPREQILKVVHEDFVPALLWWFFLFVWVTAPFFFLFPLIRQGAIGLFFLVVVAASGIFMIIRSRHARQRTALIITDQRVVDVTQRGFFNQEIAEVGHGEVEEVVFRIKGILPSVFRYGTLYLRTTGQRPDFVFRRVHRPIDLCHLLNELRGAVSDPFFDRAQKLKALADRLSDAEVDRLAAAVQNRQGQAASKDFFQS